MSGGEAVNEKAGQPAPPEAIVPAPLFILSFRQRDELAALAAGAGWQVVAARRAGGVVRRFLASGAMVAVLDARGALDEGRAAAAALAPIVAINGGALLVLVSRGDVEALGDFHDAGASHFLASPFATTELVHAVRFALRHAERVAGEERGAGSPEPLGWQYDPTTRRLAITPALAAALGLEARSALRMFLRRIDRRDRSAALSAVRRLDAERSTTAFAHDVAGLGRVVHHMQRDPRSGVVEAVVETLGSAPEPADVLSDALAMPRNAAAARRWIGRRLLAPAETPLAVLLIALNRFEIVNAAYGRAAGDILLRTALRRIEQAAGSAVVVRLGGSEFLVAVEDGPAAMNRATTQIAAELARPFPVGEAIAMLGCRIGIAVARGHDSAATLLRRASEALAEARASDSATVRMADGVTETSIDALAVELHQAIEHNEIGILFQPQVAIATGVIVGVEALARWDHATLGLLGAETLFAAAARADLEIALSDHIQRLTLQRAAGWGAPLSRLRLSLNLTAADIARPGFSDLFLDRVDASGFPRQRLTVEIVESGLIDDLGVAAALLATLRAAGCRVAIDDFGTGYSSLAYLKSLPLDYLKIDKKLAQDITGTARDRVIVRGVIDMARSLGLAVIAEGVETQEQLDLLAQDGCQIYQGFYCAPPLSEAELIQRLNAP